MTIEREWTGGTISEPGIWKNIPLEVYHNDLTLLDGPSVSKSNLKHLFPSMGGSPKQFWHLWKHNPDHITPPQTKALNLGKAVHALLLGDEVFAEKFAVQPQTYPGKTKECKWSNNADYCRAWNEAQADAGRTIVTSEQVEKIRRIAEDAAKDPIVQQGILNGAVERSLFYKDEKTGIWVKSRPDNMAFDGWWSDLKTTSSMDPRFLRRNAENMGYFLQGATVRSACNALGLPFETFVNVYVSTGDTPDTQTVELDQEDLALGESMIRAGLDQIAACLKSGVWPGARPYEGTAMRMSDLHREAIEADLKSQNMEEAA